MLEEAHADQHGRELFAAAFDHHRGNVEQADLAHLHAGQRYHVGRHRAVGGARHHALALAHIDSRALGLIQSEVGIGTAIRRYRSRFPAVIVMPQCRKDVWWTDPAMADMAKKTLELSQKEFRGDPQRTYLTGLSMGGYGTWYLAANYPGKFAAIAPICGGILRPEESRKQPAEDPRPYTEAAPQVGKTPVWIFRGGADRVVPVAESQHMAEAIKAVGAEVHYTEYPGVGHNSWERAFAEPDFMTWLLSH